MNTDTAYNYLRRLESRVTDIYSRARHFSMTHDAILAELKARVWDDPALQKTPAWVRASLVQTSQTNLSALYRPLVHGCEIDRMLADARAGKDVKPLPYLVWVHRLDGVEVTSAEVSAKREAAVRDEMAWPRLESTYVWNDTRKPFCPWASTMERASVKETTS